MSKPVAGPMDKYIGKRIRILREARNLSQPQLADKMSLSFQQVQKYETGKNRCSAVRLAELSQILDVSILSFYPEKYR